VAAPDDTRPDGFVMPDLTGLPVVSAQSMLTRVGIRSGEPKFQDVPIPAVPIPAVNGQAASGYAPVTLQPNTAPAAVPLPFPVPASAPAPAKPAALPGTVVSQSPPSGYRVEVGSTVVLTVAK